MKFITYYEGRSTAKSKIFRRQNQSFPAHAQNNLKGGTPKKMVQLQNQVKQISDKQTEAIKQIIQCRDFNLSEYRKLKRILDSRVIARRDASVFLEYCYAKVHFERYFNGHHHKAYAACCFCKGRDNLRKIENIKTGIRKWCCQTCGTNITDENIIVVPTASQSQESK